MQLGEFHDVATGRRFCIMLLPYEERLRIALFCVKSHIMMYRTLVLESRGDEASIFG